MADAPDPPPGPAWPPDLWLSPTKLKSYGNCPHRARLQYLDKVPSIQAFNLFLTQGTIAHNLLAEAARLIRGRQPLRSDAYLMDRAIRRLPPREFPTPEAREHAARDILRWVRYGISYIDRDARFLTIERPGNRPIPWRPGNTWLTISTRPDLILLRTDADGEQYVEIIDYKTGSIWADEIPPVTMRYVFKELFQSITPDTLSLRMQFTYVYLQHRDKDVIQLSPEYCQSAWANVTGAIERLMADREWPKLPSRMCHYCPYHRTACTAYDEMEPDADHNDW